MKVAVTTLAFCVAALLALGLVMLYSSSMVKAGAHDLMMQLVWCAAGFVLCAATATLDYQWLNKFAWPVYSLALLLLALVFVPHIGHASHGAHRWIEGRPHSPAFRIRQARVRHHARVVWRDTVSGRCKPGNAA